MLDYEKGLVIVMVGSDLYIQNICGMGLHFSMGSFNVVQSILAIFMWVVALIFSKEYMKNKKNKKRYYTFLFITLIATLGVFLAADLFTTFIFFEIMSLASYVWVAQEETKEAIEASNTYLAIGILGGLVMLMGLFILYAKAGTLEISSLMDACYVMENKTWLYIAGCCLLFGFGAKAGIFGLHVWMADSYTQSPAPTSALLSSMLSKTGVLGIIIVTANVFYYDIAWGILILTVGLLTMVLGAILALSAMNLKHTLAYSSMSQIGFILVGIGMSGILGSHNTVAVRGLILHMINHSFIKLILFVIAGIIFMNLGELGINEIRGYGKNKRALKLSFFIAAVGIGGIPFFNGYISKTLLHESIVEGIELGILSGNYLERAEWLFLISGGLTLAYMTKWFVAIFMESNHVEVVQKTFDEKTKYASSTIKTILISCSVFLVIVGCFPTMIADKIADMTQNIMYAETLTHEIAYFSLENLEGAFISIIIGIMVYLIVVRKGMIKKAENEYISFWPSWLNIEKLVYRPLLLTILPMIMGIICRIFDSAVDSLIIFIRKTLYKDKKLPEELEEGTVFTHFCGKVANSIQYLKNRIRNKKNGEEKDYIHIFAVKNDELVENRMIIERSMSYGLVLFCLGLSITLIYMLF